MIGTAALKTLEEPLSTQELQSMDETCKGVLYAIVEVFFRVTFVCVIAFFSEALSTGIVEAAVVVGTAYLFFIIFLACLLVVSFATCIALVLTISRVEMFIEKVTHLFDNRGVSSESLSLSRFAPNLNHKHIKAEGTSIKDQPFPEGMTLDNLSKEFSEVNFADANKPGYVLPYLLENKSVETLKEDLASFISNIKENKHIIASPQNDETRRQEYAIITHGALFCIGKINSDMEACKKGNLPDVKHDDLLKSKNEFLVKLALAGPFCFGRYTGEVDSMYKHVMKEQQRDTLHGRIGDVLTKRRMGIADQQVIEQLFESEGYFERIAAQLGLRVEEERAFQSTHYHTRHVSTFKTDFGLPGIGVEDHYLPAFKLSDKEKWKHIVVSINLLDAIVENSSMRSGQYRKKAAILREKLEEIKGL